MSKLALLAAAVVFCACAAPREAAQTPPQKPAGPGAASVFEKRNFKLVKTPDPDLELQLESLLSASYDAAVVRHSGANPMEIGFTYSLSPRGAVYPFSEIEVSCIMQDKFARRHGPGLCADFFAELERKISKAVAGRQ
ncbi:MAG: hypothetical protein A2X29_00720 [Elusimicrobia bacterium GWA2_64_40]|nr:MAG: hypothetical protein A2X29_00720 [Elusimicrobia bacterium GWA2_64_40]OGR68001.1 MAG: hypothetical protein A2X30_03425 [Elusimicrobia bacterium GWB2_63_16]